MSTCYLIYLKIPDSFFRSRLSFLIKNSFQYDYNNGYEIGLYAYTFDKKICKRFLHDRNSDFFYYVAKKDVSKKHLPDFLISAKRLDMKLSEYDIETVVDGKIKTVPLVATRNEYITVNNFGTEYLYEFLFDKLSFTETDCQIFNKKIYKALDSLGIIDSIKEFDDEDEMDAEADLRSHNASYGLTTQGNKLFTRRVDQLGALVYLYDILFDSKSAKGGKKYHAANE